MASRWWISLGLLCFFVGALSPWSGLEGTKSDPAPGHGSIISPESSSLSLAQALVSPALADPAFPGFLLADLGPHLSPLVSSTWANIARASRFYKLEPSRMDTNGGRTRWKTPTGGQKGTTLRQRGTKIERSGDISCGLPTELPAALEEGLDSDPGLCRLVHQVQSLERGGATGPLLKKARAAVGSYRKSLKRRALRTYQQKWIRERRDWKILTRGKERASDDRKTDLTQNLCLLIPERGRLARQMAAEDPLPSDEMWCAMQDLYSLCMRDLTVLYLPGLQPVDGQCPVKCCRKRLDSLPKPWRNQHVMACRRRDMASKLDHLESSVHYCYLCYNWIIGAEWEPHCQNHIQTRKSKTCGTATFCHTLVRPGFNRFRLGDNKSLLPSQRLQSWSRDFALWADVMRCLEGRAWPMPCPHPHCDLLLPDEITLQYHFIDEHRFSRTRPGLDKRTPQQLEERTSSNSPPCEPASCRRKRKAARNNKPLQWVPAHSSTISDAAKSPLCEPPSKRARLDSPVCPPLLSRVEVVGGTSRRTVLPSPSPAISPIAASRLMCTDQDTASNVDLDDGVPFDDSLFS